MRVAYRSVFFVHFCKNLASTGTGFFLRGSTVYANVHSTFSPSSYSSFFVLPGDTSVLFVNSHFAAHQNSVEDRNGDFRKICFGTSLKCFPKPALKPSILAFSFL